MVGDALEHGDQARTNEIHGSARLYETDHHFQSTTFKRLAGIAAGNHINSITDTGAYRRTDREGHSVRLLRSRPDQPGSTEPTGPDDAEDFNAKLNWQIVPSNVFDIWYPRSNKLKFRKVRPPSGPDPGTDDSQNVEVRGPQIIGSICSDRRVQRRQRKLHVDT